MPVEITRRVEFDAGHRIPNHASKCRNIHGHRYRLEATVSGAVLEARGESDDGMIVDFGLLKQVMSECVADRWDHAFLCWEGDHSMCWVLEHARDELGDHRTVIMPDVPTAENLAQAAFRLIDGGLQTAGAPFELVRVRLYETPNCWADATRGET